MCGARYLSREGARGGLEDGRKDAEEAPTDARATCFNAILLLARSFSKSIFLHYTVISGVNRPD